MHIDCLPKSRACNNIAYKNNSLKEYQMFAIIQKLFYDQKVINIYFIALHKDIASKNVNGNSEEMITFILKLFNQKS